MIKSILFPERSFATKSDIGLEIKKNLDDIIALKKAEIYKSCEKGQTISCRPLDVSKFSDDQNKAFKIDPAYYYIAANTTLVLDSHDDLHVNGIWGKSVKEQQRKNYLVADHELCIDDVIVKREYVEMMVASMPFALLGFDYQGETEVLIYKVPKDKVIHQKAKDWLESGDSIEASVRMQYVVIEFALDSNNPEDAKAKERYDQYFPMIANKADFEYIPYFFIIKEAKNVREASLVVFGSNPVTGKINEPAKVTQEKQDPPLSSQKSKSIYSHFLN